MRERRSQKWTNVRRQVRTKDKSEEGDGKEQKNINPTKKQTEKISRQ